MGAPWTLGRIRPSPHMSVGSEFSGIPLNPQHNVWARSTEKRRRVMVYRFGCLKILRMHFYAKNLRMHFGRFIEIFRAGISNFYKVKFQATKRMKHFTWLRFSVLRARTLRCEFRGIPENSEPTPICGLGRIFPWVHRPHCLRFETSGLFSGPFFDLVQNTSLVRFSPLQFL